MSVMLANNEVGTVQPIAELAVAARTLGIPVHTDAVQAAGTIPLDMTALGVDALSISGHKLGAPKGIGALAVRRLPLEPTQHGGGQQRGKRSGTENVAGAVGLAAAIRLSTPVTDTSMRDDFIREVLAALPGAMLTGSRDSRLATNASFCFPGTSGEAILLELGRRGIVCSAGSACAAGSDEPSRVLLSMGIAPEVAQTAVRFTFDSTTTAHDLAGVVHELVAAEAAVRMSTTTTATPIRTGGTLSRRPGEGMLGE
jgi:cysteine desulfurase